MSPNLSAMPCFWVVFTAFRGLVRHGCRGLVGWQMVLACGSGSSDRVSGGSLSVSVWLSCVVCGTTVWSGRKVGKFGVGFRSKFPILVCAGQRVPVGWLWSWDDCPRRRGFVPCWFWCCVGFCRGSFILCFGIFCVVVWCRLFDERRMGL